MKQGNIERHFLLAINNHTQALEIEREFAEEFHRLDCRAVDSYNELQAQLKVTPMASLLFVDENIFGQSWLPIASSIRKNNKTLRIYVISAILSNDLRDKLETIEPRAFFLPESECTAEKLVGIANTAYYEQDVELADSQYSDTIKRAIKIIDRVQNRSRDRELLQVIFNTLVSRAKILLSEFEYRTGIAALSLIGYDNHPLAKSIIEDLPSTQRLIIILNFGANSNQDIPPNQRNIYATVELTTHIYSRITAQQSVTVESLKTKFSPVGRRLLMNISNDTLKHIEQQCQERTSESKTSSA